MKENLNIMWCWIYQIRKFLKSNTDLINIMTGVHAESSVNVQKAREVGQSILDSMTGKPAAEYSFTKSNQAITFSAKSSVKVDGEKIQVDP